MFSAVTETRGRIGLAGGCARVRPKIAAVRRVREECAKEFPKKSDTFPAASLNRRELYGVPIVVLPVLARTRQKLNEKERERVR